MRVNHPSVLFARYADDIVVHCRSESQAQVMLRAIELRLARCKLRLHPQRGLSTVKTQNALEVISMRVLIFSAMASASIVQGADLLCGLYASGKQISNQSDERYDKGLETAVVEFLVIRGHCQANQPRD